MTNEGEFAPMAGRLISLKEAEERGFGSRMTLYRRIKKGEFKAVKFEGKIMLIGDDLLKYLSEHTVQPDNAA